MGAEATPGTSSSGKQTACSRSPGRSLPGAVGPVPGEGAQRPCAPQGSGAPNQQLHSCPEQPLTQEGPKHEAHSHPVPLPGSLK